MKPEPLIIFPKTTESISEAINPTITLGVEDVVNAMNVVGFQDEGRKRVIKVIREQFEELLQGNTDVIRISSKSQGIRQQSASVITYN
jgi:hypothetical protein